MILYLEKTNFRNISVFIFICLFWCSDLALICWTPN